RWRRGPPRPARSHPASRGLPRRHDLDRDRCAHLGRLPLLDRFRAPQERRPQVGCRLSPDLSPLPPPQPRHLVVRALDPRRGRRARMTAPAAAFGSSRRTAWLVAGLFLLGAAIRALRFAAPFHWPFHWDETQVAVPALRILGGSLPVNVVG